MIENFVHVVAALVLIGRLGDIGSTYYATPSLALEANPLARRLGWRLALASLLLCVLPYYNTALGVVVAVPSLLVASSNFMRAWFMRALGEEEMLDVYCRAAARIAKWKALSGVVLGAAFFALVAVLLFFLSGGPQSWGYWVALGLLLHAFGMGLYGAFGVNRVYRRTQGLQTAEID